MEEQAGYTKIITMNANGFPSNKANLYKTKALNQIMRKNDILVALETGINDSCKPRRISDDHQVVRINY